MANLKDTLIDKNSVGPISLTVNQNVTVSGGNLKVKNGVIQNTATSFNFLDGLSYGSTNAYLFGNASTVTLFKNTTTTPALEIRGSDSPNDATNITCPSLFITNMSATDYISSIATKAYSSTLTINGASFYYYDDFCSIDFLSENSDEWIYFVGTDSNKNRTDICGFGNDYTSLYSNSSITVQEEAVRGILSINNHTAQTRSGISWMSTQSSYKLNLPGYLKILNHSTDDRYTFIQNSDVLDGCIAIEQTPSTTYDWEGGLSLYNYNYSQSEWTIFIGASDDMNAKKGYLGFNYKKGNSVYGATNAKAYINPDTIFTKMNFTGQHRNIGKQNISFYEDKIGLIVVSSGVYSNFYENKNSINQALPVVELSYSRMQKKVFGVISNTEDDSQEFRSYAIGNWGFTISKENDQARLIINSVGEGGIWVTNINGNLENGDYITTCEIPGYGMKQDSEFLHNYTVAKITCDCEFDLDSPIYICEEFEWEGQTFRRAFVGCTYHCG